MELERYAELFFTETREHLSAMNELILELESRPDNRQALDGLFRSVHTIKGMAATMGYTAMSGLAHEVENLLDQLRSGRRRADPGLVDVLLAGADALEMSVAHAAGERAEPCDSGPYLARLQQYLDGSAPEEAATVSAREVQPPAVPGLWARVRLPDDAPLKGARSFLVVRAAEQGGQLAECHPPVAAFQEPDFPGVFFLRFTPGIDRDHVRATLVDAGEGAQVDFLEVAEEAAVATPDSTPVDARPLRGRVSSIRVDISRLDALQDQIGELVVLRSWLRRAAREHPTGELLQLSARAYRLISALQDEILKARMVPVWQVFDRFPRLVRDAARTLEKEVELVVEGQEIGLDRSVLDEIVDPLVHLLRNAVDHGIEPPHEREASGKPRVGRILLAAARQGDSVVITVQDDGRGIIRARVVEKALQSGIIELAEAESLGVDDIIRLVLRTGFSTAERVTSLSGRGVGMDVLATRVRALAGNFEIHSEEGVGTRVTIRLPLTLAITRALLVRVAGEVYAIPGMMIGETLPLDASMLSGADGDEVAAIGQKPVRVLRLRKILQTPAKPEPPQPIAAVVDLGNSRVALIADEVVEEQEIVVKSFQATRGAPPFFSGATILADGRPALILDPANLASVAAS
ncbi:MAG: chemotaxis protein CheA [Gemmatimonadetes bacterium]|nr:chemotaxis protein CheA [Gemmatimonadota bacterium]